MLKTIVHRHKMSKTNHATDSNCNRKIVEAEAKSLL